jgi:hypothetical protein
MTDDDASLLVSVSPSARKRGRRSDRSTSSGIDVNPRRGRRAGDLRPCVLGEGAQITSTVSSSRDPATCLPQRVARRSDCSSSSQSVNSNQGGSHEKNGSFGCLRAGARHHTRRHASLDDRHRRPSAVWRNATVWRIAADDYIAAARARTDGDGVRDRVPAIGRRDGRRTGRRHRRTDRRRGKRVAIHGRRGKCLHPRQREDVGRRNRRRWWHHDPGWRHGYNRRSNFRQ